MRRRHFIGGLAGTAAAVTGAVRAQAWPERPVRLIVPFPPGSAADAIPRAIGAQLEGLLGAPFTIDNRPGASGAIGTALAAQAAPDGHTFLAHTSAIAIQPHIVPAPFDVLRDFVPVTQTIAGSYVLVTRSGFPATDLPQFVREVRAAPGRYSYASYGNGSGTHLAMELLKQRAGLYIVHVPFRGAAAGMQELLAGRVDAAFDTTFAAVPHVREGRVQAIALGGPQPVDALPGVETVASHYAGFDSDGWQGLFAPAGTPQPVVTRLAEAVAAALRSEPLVRRMATSGFRAVGSTPDRFAWHVRAEFARWGAVVRERGIHAE